MSFSAYHNEIKKRQLLKTNFSTIQPYEYINVSAIPLNWDWNDINGTSYLTKVLN